MNPNVSQTNIFRAKDVHTSGICFLKMYKNTFNISSYKQKQTHNSIHALEITIYNTNHTNNTQTNFKEYNCFESSRTSNYFNISIFLFDPIYQTPRIYILYIYIYILHFPQGLRTPSTTSITDNKQNVAIWNSAKWSMWCNRYDTNRIATQVLLTCATVRTTWNM